MTNNDDYETQKFAREVAKREYNKKEEVKEEITQHEPNPIPESEDSILNGLGWQEIMLPNGQTVLLNTKWRDDFFKGTVGENSNK